MAEGNITVKFQSKGVDEVSDDMNDVSSAASGFSLGLGNIASLGLKAAAAIAAVGAAAAGAAAAMTAKGVSDAFSWGGDLLRQSSAIGATIKDTMLLSQAFKENGGAAVNLEGTITKLQKRIAEGSEAFKLLGVSAESLKGRSATEQIKMLGEAIRNVGSQEERARAVMQLFEEQGMQLMQFFNNPDALEQAARTLGTSIDVMSRNAEDFERASTLISNIGLKFKTFFAGVAEGVVGPLTSLLEAFNSYDLAEHGRMFGEYVEYAIEALRRAFDQDKLPELFRLSAGLAVAVLLDGAVKVGDLIVEGVKRAWAWMQDSVESFGRDIGEAAGAAIYGIVTGDDATVADYMRGRIRREMKSKAAPEARTSYTDAALSRLSEFGRIDLGLQDWTPRARSSSSDSARESAASRMEIPEVNFGSVGGGSGLAVDALARIGGMLGGMSDPSVIATQETAKNTRKTNEYLRTIARAQANSPSGAVFA